MGHYPRGGGVGKPYIADKHFMDIWAAGLSVLLALVFPQHSLKAIYSALFEGAPQLQALFTTPRAVQALCELGDTEIVGSCPLFYSLFFVSLCLYIYIYIYISLSISLSLPLSLSLSLFLCLVFLISPLSQ